MSTSGKAVTSSDAELDREFFSPRNPRGEKSIFLECPPVGFALLLAGGLLAYRIRMYPIRKAQGQDMLIYLYTTRLIVCGTISGIFMVTVSSARLLDKASKTAPCYQMDHTPRKLPNQKLKPMTENPMALTKTNILEQVLIERFTAKK